MLLLHFIVFNKIHSMQALPPTLCNTSHISSSYFICNASYGTLDALATLPSNTFMHAHAHAHIFAMKISRLMHSLFRCAFIFYMFQIAFDFCRKCAMYCIVYVKRFECGEPKQRAKAKIMLKC